MMVSAAPGRLARRARRLSPRAAVVTGGALMVAGQVVLAVMLFVGDGLPSLDASALLVLPVILAGIVLLWLGPVVVAMAADQPAWIGAIALPGGYAAWVLGTLGASSLPDGAVLAIAEGGLPVFAFAGALAVVGGGRVWYRLAGVAVIAGLAGALNHALQGSSAVVYLGLLVAFAFLAWVTPRTRPSSTPASREVTAGAPDDGR
jgi:hypothetical protein